MTNDERNPKFECRKVLRGAGAGFVIWILSFLRIWSFVIRICRAGSWRTGPILRRGGDVPGTHVWRNAIPTLFFNATAAGAAVTDPVTEQLSQLFWALF